MMAKTVCILLHFKWHTKKLDNKINEVNFLHSLTSFFWLDKKQQSPWLICVQRWTGKWKEEGQVVIVFKLSSTL